MPITRPDPKLTNFDPRVILWYFLFTFTPSGGEEMSLSKTLGWSGWKALCQDVKNLRHGEGRLVRFPMSDWLMIAVGCIERARLADSHAEAEKEAGVVCELLARKVITLDDLQASCEISIEELEELASINLYVT
ncbi:hypothetical protein KJ758_01260 [Patescibacteria group bacterium]|nr:hypothetical protein [Patescibacteria group bacterium]